MSSHAEKLRNIKRFDQLVAYLRDDLDWPIEKEDFEDLTFDWDADELGVDLKTAAKIQTIKQLRPLVSRQEWGIFFVKFEPKRLPVVALRRLLNKLVIKKRQTARSADAASWRLNDLLFVSEFGEGEDRQITLAHFSEGASGHDIPTLMVLGWDELDTHLNLEHIDRQLHSRLKWPEDPQNLDAWRKQWSSAFTLRHRQVIATAQDLAERLAVLAKAIRQKVQQVLDIETDNGTLQKLYTAFREALLHDLTEDGFADTYAQTITYGLFSAAVSRTTPDGGTVVLPENITDMVPVTNPFLREMLARFLTVGGRKDSLDFDELGIQEVVDVLNSPDTNLMAVIRNFGDRRQGEDPVVHFYEDFLKQYDKKLKVERGVFYTPQPAVSYIVRSVHELLQTEFGLEDGLASTITWREMTQLHKGLEIPKGAKPDDPFVVILDPATGTGTFLVEVIDVIHRTMLAKWHHQRMNAAQQNAAWNEYVPKYLLPRLFGYELMMAPYAIAHMKLGLKLQATGFTAWGKLGQDDRVRIYLTNALEPWVQQLPLIGFDALAHEAAAVNEIKRHKRFTVVIGNPPYAAFSCNPSKDKKGKLTLIGSLIEDYKFIAGQPVVEKKWWLQDDYVKFIRFTEWIITKAGTGIAGLITSHSYLDNPTFRGMRWHLLQSFNRLLILNLHGNSKTAGKTTEESQDQNVFDIQQGVAVLLAVSLAPQTAIAKTQYADMRGPRPQKYQMLTQHTASSLPRNVVDPKAPGFLLVPQNNDREAEYSELVPLTDVFLIKSVGFVTARDALTIAETEDAMWIRVKRFLALPTEDARLEFDLGKDARDWKIEFAQKDLRDSGPSKERIVPVCYRPFDTRFTYYSGRSRGFIGQPQRKVMNHIIGGDNLALVVTRQQSVVGGWSLVGVSNRITESSYISNKTAEINYVFPLRLAAEGEEMLGSALDMTSQPTNLNPSFSSSLQDMLRQRAPIPPEDIFHYAYAVLHSPGYRCRYAEFLKIDFPRLPLTGNLELFRSLARLGGELTALHLLESPKLQKSITRYVGRTREVKKVGWTADNGGTVWINASGKKNATTAGTIGFAGVPENVWSFHIGGYQVCEKWLKDRKGRTLTDEDVAHYHKMVVALSETIRLMAEIDTVINQHGGWPGAFVTAPPATEEEAAKPTPHLPFE